MRVERRGALTLILAAVAVAATAARADDFTAKWHDGDPAPDVEGVHLGDTRAQVIKVLGQPEEWLIHGPHVDKTGTEFLRFRHGALIVSINSEGHVVRIVLRRAEGGSIAGFKVGDRIGKLLWTWGMPTESHGKVGHFVVGDWTITVQADFGTQQILGLVLAQTGVTPIPGLTAPIPMPAPSPSPAPAGTPAPAVAPPATPVTPAAPAAPATPVAPTTH